MILTHAIVHRVFTSFFQPTAALHITTINYYLYTPLTPHGSSM